MLCITSYLGSGCLGGMWTGFMGVACCPRSEQHGEQMLNLISRTLSSRYHDTAQVAVALEGVVLLCQHEVVDVVTVWAVLGKGGKLTSDLRPAVQVALCSLFCLASDLNPDPTHSHKVCCVCACMCRQDAVLERA